MLPFYTSWLSVEDYGLTDLLSVYSSLLVCVLTLSLHEAIFVFPVGKSKLKQGLYFSNGLIVILSLAFCFAILCFVFKYIYNNNCTDTFVDNLWFLYCMYLSTAIQTYLQQFCRSINKMRTFCYSGILCTGFTALFSFFLIPRYGVLGFVLSLLISNMLSSVFIIFLEKIYSFIYFRKLNRHIIRQMLWYSFPMIPNTLMWWVLSAINRPILESYLGLSGIGLFAVANKYPTVLSQINNIFTSSWQVSVLEEYEKESFKLFYNRVGNSILSFVIFSSSCLAILSPLAIKYTTDEKFHSVWSFVPIMTTAAIFQFISSHTGTLFSAAKKSKYFLYSSVFGAISSVIFNACLIPFLGLYGAALSFSISQLAIAITRYIYANRIVDVSISKYNLLMFILILLLIICMLFEYMSLAVLIFLTLAFVFIGYNGRIFFKQLNLRK